MSLEPGDVSLEFRIGKIGGRACPFDRRAGQLPWPCRRRRPINAKDDSHIEECSMG